jgi:DNA-binding HxlR family transcriptional regulator
MWVKKANGLWHFETKKHLYEVVNHVRGKWGLNIFSRLKDGRLKQLETYDFKKKFDAFEMAVNHIIVELAQEIKAYK